MKRITTLFSGLAIALVLTVGLSACGQKSRTPAPVKQIQSQKAKEAANSISFTENAEIENIKNRLELTSSPDLTGFVILLNDMGQPVMYTSVKGKITSGGKRLTAPQRFVRGDRGQAFGDFLAKAASDEGTWGSSNPYVYFWTMDGQYIQWNGAYLYSDKPFRLSIKPLVIDSTE